MIAEGRRRTQPAARITTQRARNAARESFPVFGRCRPRVDLRRYGHRVAGLDAMADQLRANADVFEEIEVAEMLEALLAVAAQLRTVLPE